MDIRKMLDNAQRSMSNTYDSGVDAVLGRLGLEPKKSSMEIVLPALGVFGAGIVLGAALGLLFAPKRGEEIRTDIRHRLSDLREKGYQQYEEIREKSSNFIDEVPLNLPGGNGAKEKSA